MSRIALISDVHANLPALEAVIYRLEKEAPDIWICLGDIVGYGPHPSECIELIREKEMICVMGNHDAGIVGHMPLEHFGNPNRKLIEMTMDIISGDQKQWLENLPLIQKDPAGKWLSAHASPEKPEEWEYLESAFKVRRILPKLDQAFCFSGHTHRPAFVSDKIGLKELKAGHKYLINPGSVGQPRDGDLRASCSFLDTDQLIYKNIRVRFEVERVVGSLEKLGFSRKAAEHMMRYS